MNKRITLVFISFSLLISLASYCQKGDEYQVYALKYLAGGKGPAKNGVVGANPKDSIDVTFMVWLLKGENGRNILVDAGYLDTVKIRWKGYIRPDSLLERINVYPSDITDVIMTHPHYDHIGGINLFPKAIVWMQKDDFDYFVGEAWHDKETSKYYRKNDVRNIIEINLQGRLKLVKGDDIEIMPGIRVYIGSKHSFENMYLLVNSNSKTNKILIASDAIWFYYQLDNLLPATLCLDPVAYVAALKRMKTLVSNPDLIIPGHDNLVFSKFPKVAEGVVKIGN
jgi:glyoxylase-like metal-dependent hydrolase (beta-lactamase superfamily II)